MSVFNPFSGETNSHGSREVSDGANFLFAELAAAMVEMGRSAATMSEADQPQFGAVEQAFISTQIQHPVEAQIQEVALQPLQATREVTTGIADSPSEHVATAEHIAPVIPISNAPSYQPPVETNGISAVDPNADIIDLQAPDVPMDLDAVRARVQGIHDEAA